MNGFKNLPKGAKVLILVAAAVIGGAVIFNSGHIVGSSIAKATSEEEAR